MRPTNEQRVKRTRATLRLLREVEQGRALTIDSVADGLDLARANSLPFALAIWEVARFPDLSDQFRAFVDTLPCRLTPTEMCICLYMASRCGRYIPPCEFVQPLGFAMDNGMKVLISQHIANVRSKGVAVKTWFRRGYGLDARSFAAQ